MQQEAAWTMLQAFIDREVVAGDDRSVPAASDDRSASTGGGDRSASTPDDSSAADGAPPPRPLRVLEAGCGSMSHVRLGDDPVVVGVDVSAHQLRRNDTLDLPVLGDLHALPVADASFDVVVCWDVVEHLHTPVAALEHMERALRLGGHLVLGFPNLLSAKGLLTRWTPHGFHVWVYRNVLGSKTAGTEDHGPFPTFLRPETTPSGIQAWARDRGMEVAFFQLYESEMQALMVRRNPAARAYVRGLGRVVQAVTGGRIRAAESDVIAVLRKPRD